MGYYAQLDYEIGEAIINSQKAKDIEEFFADEMNDGVNGFYNVRLELEGDNLQDIILEDYYAKFYDDEMFANKLAEALEGGYVKLRFAGEDGGLWGYIISSRKVEDLVFLSVTEKEYKKIKEILEVEKDRVL